ncbi:hypothetical protein HHK36_010431 [Tetracentron sinense]|uniref:Protein DETOXIFICATION n=1 Tax=Tetracentron sinense TaxID=13715 RepID=A0A834ZE02_TETSI|nr:hypothetical protein HHK36_010431 [Tetracentron sinense]
MFETNFIVDILLCYKCLILEMACSLHSHSDYWGSALESGDSRDFLTMTAIQSSSAPFNGQTCKTRERKAVKYMTRSSAPRRSTEVLSYFTLINRRGVRSAYVVEYRHPFVTDKKQVSSLVTPCQQHIFHAVRNQHTSDCGVGPSNAEEGIIPKKVNNISGLKEGIFELTGNHTKQSRSQSIKSEFLMLSLPAIAGQAIEPLAQLMETAYIGRLGNWIESSSVSSPSYLCPKGPVELASAGVSISIFNIISKLFNIPLLSVATSFVAEEIIKNERKESTSDGGCREESNNGRPLDEKVERKQLPSVSTALLLAIGIGIFEALALYFGSGPFLNMMGISSASSMRIPAQRFLALRALGAPAVVVSLALQGVFRGFKDTKTPVICLGAGNFAAIFLFSILMFYFRLGVTGAAIATVASQYIVTCLMIWYLNKRAVLLPPKMENLQFGGYIRSGGFLLGRTLAVLMTLTLATSMAARQGPLAMAAHQICLQVWLAVSLLTDALASSGQAMIASSYSKGDYATVKEITYFVLKNLTCILLQTGLLTGVSLAVVLGVSFGHLATLFTKDPEVLRIVRSGILFVSASQPINALAFISDGLHYGVSDFAYAARSMMVVGAISSAFLLYAPSIFGLSGVWSGLALFMGLRMLAGYIRLVSKTGPWWFLYKDFQKIEEKGEDRRSNPLVSPRQRTKRSHVSYIAILEESFQILVCIGIPIEWFLKNEKKRSFISSGKGREDKAGPYS